MVRASVLQRPMRSSPIPARRTAAISISCTLETCAYTCMQKGSVAAYGVTELRHEEFASVLAPTLGAARCSAIGDEMCVRD